MVWIAAALATVAAFFAVRYCLIWRELKRLNAQLSELRENARYGRRLYLEENISALAEAMSAINQMIDGTRTICGARKKWNAISVCPYSAYPTTSERR
ncbi:MAG: hypothetical protein LBU32_05445 [Clostridiales bacterium]|jgi:hypothetical protein|nr:hypothetical protein [Clostridiales bacterium]